MKRRRVYKPGTSLKRWTAMPFNTGTTFAERVALMKDDVIDLDITRDGEKKTVQIPPQRSREER